jgi:hypothetical protein
MLVIAVFARALAGWSTKESVQDVAEAVRTLAGSTMKSFPGDPLKLLACLATRAHVDEDELPQAANRTVMESPGGMERFLRTSVLATSVAVADVLVNPVVMIAPG